MTKEELLRQLEGLRRDHHVEENDDWYSCPKSGQCKDKSIHDCNCGADYHNARLNGLIQRVKETTAWD